MAATILIVDDESDIRRLIQGILEDEGYATAQAENAGQAFDRINEQVPDLVILDIWLKNSTHDGLEILEAIKKDHPHIPILMISGHGTIETAVSAIKQGAYDFIEKPFKSDSLLLMIERALEIARLRQENEQLRQKATGPAALIGDSPAMTGLRQALDRVAQTNSRVLITGEAGTGKDIAARIIHKHSKRAESAFMTLNCAILRPERLEAELFGTVGENTGVLEQANGGTLLLDEVADMPLETQGKIVRVLQEQRIQRLGGQGSIEIDVRIIASTNRNLQKAMEDGHFRQDLYYRLSVVPVEMPPLRDRPQDIPQLAGYFAKIYSRQSGMPACSFSQSAEATLQAYQWPGNVRQLRNVIEWLMIMKGGGSEEPVRPDQLPPEINAMVNGTTDVTSNTNLMGIPLRDARELFEREYLALQIKRFGGNISKTAQFVGMERSALHRKLKQLGISALTKQNDTESPAQEWDGRQTA